MRSLPLALVVFIAFGAFSTVVIVQHGYLGFVTLALREPWGMQMLIDLGIALMLASGWLVPDARRRGLSAWPWLVGSVFVGSLSMLGYVIYRHFFGRTVDPEGALPAPAPAAR